MSPLVRACRWGNGHRRAAYQLAAGGHCGRQRHKGTNTELETVTRRRATTTVIRHGNVVRHTTGATSGLLSASHCQNDVTSRLRHVTVTPRHYAGYSHANITTPHLWACLVRIFSRFE